MTHNFVFTDRREIAEAYAAIICAYEKMELVNVTIPLDATTPLSDKCMTGGSIHVHREYAAAHLRFLEANGMLVPEELAKRADGVLPLVRLCASNVNKN